MSGGPIARSPRSARHPRATAAAVLVAGAAALVTSSCATSGQAWLEEGLAEGTDFEGSSEPQLTARDLAEERRGPAKSRETIVLGQRRAAKGPPPGSRPQVNLSGEANGRVTFDTSKIGGRLVGVFRNTYYDFPGETDHQGPSVPVHGPKCSVIAEVRQSFFETLCVQGSGRLQNGQTVSFSRRDCDCATECPRTGQKICFEALDQAKFPWGRGARGTPITPLKSVAVDSNVIPLGTGLYIPEYDGLPSDAAGTRHDGCFVAEDRGLKVQGLHVDVFTGDEATTKNWNALVPSNSGVHVFVDTTRCPSPGGAKPAPQEPVSL